MVEFEQYNRGMRFEKFVEKVFFLVICCLFLTRSSLVYETLAEKVYPYTSSIRFNYLTWTLKSLALKTGEAGLDFQSNLSEETQKRVVLEYFEYVRQQIKIEEKIEQIYANPSTKDPAEVAAVYLSQRDEYQRFLDQLAPIAEEILQNQVKETLISEGIDLGGQEIPPVLYHTTPVPKALIVSPRDRIVEEVNTSLMADLSLSQINDLESSITDDLDVSTLVVDIGGVGVYPTMVMRSSDMAWVIETIAHEWTHNYLTFSPLGLKYDASDSMRTMNETTASIVGREISQKVFQRYYPDLLTSAGESNSVKLAGSSVSFEDFDFNTEMHTTRVTVDKLLSEGKITEAEAYMEARRQVFLDHGYLIRKLNQAYFAFYGAYADIPIGAAGADPVGPAVRTLRENSNSLADFLKEISRMSSFGDLQAAIE